MKNLRLLGIGLLLTIMVLLAQSITKADGIKPIDPNNDPPPCVCTCYALTITEAGIDQPGQTYPGQLTVSGTFATSSLCSVTIVATAAPVDDHGNIGNPVFVGAYSTLANPGTYYIHGPHPTAHALEVQVYIIRMCDQHIIGWSDEVYVGGS